MKRLECLVALLAVGVVSSVSGELWGSSLQRFSDQVILAPSRCLPQAATEVPIGGNCGVGQTCVGEGFCSSCVAGSCTCMMNFAAYDPIGMGDPRRICIGTTRIGDRCQIDEQCVALYNNETSSCSGTSGQCQCITGFIHSESFLECLPIRNGLDNQCDDNAQCTAGEPGVHSECLRNECKCKPNAVNVIGEHKCYLRATQLGGQCEVRVQCEVLRAICSPNDVCVCDGDNIAHPDGSICLPRRPTTGEECVDDVQCITNSKCVKSGNDPSGICTCEAGFKESTSGRTCYTVAEKLGDSCIPNDDTGNIQCGTNIRGQVVCEPATPTNTTHGSCKCFGGYVGSGDGKACLAQVPELGTECVDDNQCVVPNSQCLRETPEAASGVCACQDGHRNQPGEMTKCWQIRREVNLECEIDFQCRAGLGDLSDCKDHICQCRDLYGYYPDQGRCLAPARMGWPCNETEQCYVGVRPISRFFLCTNNTEGSDGINRCVCRPDAKEFEQSCYDPNIVLGSDCKSDAQCTVNIHRGTSLCDRNTEKCVCAEGFTEDASKVICSTGSGIFSHYSFILVGVVTLFLKALL